jgi:hypothetical protein
VHVIHMRVIDADQQTVSLLTNGHDIPTKYEQTNDLRIKKK